MVEKSVLTPKDAAISMGAYSHGLKVDMGNVEMIFVTGQIAKDNEGKIVGLGDVVKQTEFVFQKIDNILKEGGSSLDDVVKAVIYVTDMSKFKEISKVRNAYFAKSRPVSTFVEISKTVTEGCDIEIDVIAVKDKE